MKHLFIWILVLFLAPLAIQGVEVEKVKLIEKSDSDDAAKKLGQEVKGVVRQSERNTARRIESEGQRVRTHIDSATKSAAESVTADVKAVIVSESAANKKAIGDGLGEVKKSVWIANTLGSLGLVLGSILLWAIWKTRHIAKEEPQHIDALPDKPVNPNKNTINLYAERTGRKRIPFIYVLKASGSEPEFRTEAIAELRDGEELPFVWFEGESSAVHWKDQSRKAAEIARRVVSHV